MSKTLLCIQMSRILIIIMAIVFIVFSLLRMWQTTIIPWPTYPATVAILLDIVLLIGLIASLTQHLKMLIFFSWLNALTFLLIFFGNIVSSQYQSDLIGMFYLLFICILAFTDSVCIIKYRMPCEEAHLQQQTSMFVGGKSQCSPQQIFLEQTMTSDLMPPIVPPPPRLVSSSSSSSAHHAHHYSSHQQQQQPQPQQHSSSYSSSHHHHHSQSSQHHSSGGGGSGHSNSNLIDRIVGPIQSPTTPPLPPPPPLNSHYVPKNDPQFHAV